MLIGLKKDQKREIRGIRYVSFQSHCKFFVSATGPVTCKQGLTGLESEGRAVDIVYPNFSEAFDPDLHKISMDKLTASVLDEKTVRWDREQLSGQA